MKMTWSGLESNMNKYDCHILHSWCYCVPRSPSRSSTCLLFGFLAQSFSLIYKRWPNVVNYLLSSKAFTFVDSCNQAVWGSRGSIPHISTPVPSRLNYVTNATPTLSTIRLEPLLVQHHIRLSDSGVCEIKAVAPIDSKPIWRWILIACGCDCHLMIVLMPLEWCFSTLIATPELF